jgi:hypothetical protein
MWGAGASVLSILCRICVGNVPAVSARQKEGALVKRLGLVIVGLGMLFYSWRLYTVPLPAGAPERTAVLYKYLGQQGQAAVGAILGLIFLIAGLILVLNTIKDIRRR